MLSKTGFDDWSKQYDKDILKTDTYPFAGYHELMNDIIAELNLENKPEILDIGIGTGILSSLLAKKGARITGVDFSDEMLKLAKERIPQGRFIRQDLNNGLGIEVTQNRYDYIISTYVFHHFTDEVKIKLIRTLFPLLMPGGKIIIGDVAFVNDEVLQNVKRNSQGFDEEEIYIVYDRFKKELNDYQISYTQISFCAGLLIINKR